MIHVGIDDTDTLDSPGTNQLARALARRLATRCRTLLIVRHQLLSDPRIPCTSKNGSASLLLEPRGPLVLSDLVSELRAGMREGFVPGSDPGLCVAPAVPDDIVAFGRRWQHEIVAQEEARALAHATGLHLEGLGGTEGGVIGALAAVGLAATGDDGRVVQLGDWPDDLSGPQELDVLRARGIVIRCASTGDVVVEGIVDVGKHLRPNCRQGRIVLFVTPADGTAPDVPWQAVRLP
ncbi:MAG: ABC transporter substrate-binding protein [Planctomycetes bacterium]|nr:ABC transporter substrate-binding protein [Planctomycetota bacterium]